jgi:7-cyano-7-deazaguanine synthase in queuosine biosynthesis
MSKAVHCRVQGLRAAFPAQKIEFRSGTELKLIPQSPLGPRGLSESAEDLLDFATAVYQIEKQLSGRQRTNPPVSFQLRMPLRNPKRWNADVRHAASALLNLLGNATWELTFQASKLRSVSLDEADSGKVEQVMLFSGGLDSACGAVQLAKEAEATRPVSFYTRQKKAQQQLAEALGFARLVQWRKDWTRKEGRGHSFYYRSLLFLSIAAASASSWGKRTIFQFENGILASAIAPAPSWSMTKHAHPRLTALAVELFSRVLGGEWRIINPFITLTKRECVEAAIAVGGKKTMPLLERTETCWYQWSNRVPGGKKRPGTSCGICIPCLLRRTALPKAPFAFDLRRDRIRNHRQLGRAFRAYFAFLRRVLQAKTSDAFYFALPAAGRSLIGTTPELTSQQLQRLFSKFAREFMNTYDL